MCRHSVVPEVVVSMCAFRRLGVYKRGVYRRRGIRWDHIAGVGMRTCWLLIEDPACAVGVA